MTYLPQRRLPNRRARRSVRHAIACVGLLAFFALASSPQSSPPPDAPKAPDGLFDRIVANQAKTDATLELFERIQRVETRKSATDPKPSDVRTWRVFPAGPATVKIPLSSDGRPLSQSAYRSDLEKLERYLLWAARSGRDQREAYARAERKRKERTDLVSSARQAFLFTKDGEESRDGRNLTKYALTPNPKYKPTTRNGAIFAKVRGTVWVDESSAQVVRIEGTVVEDISLALFLAQVYKGSHFMQERQEIDGVWLPTLEEYDFDGHKFIFPISIHERTTYSHYRRVGSPAEAAQLVRNELNGKN